MKMPPKEKIPEAYSALADGRVEMIGDNEAQVTSSDGAKTYTVRWSGDIYASSDNATYWQGYPGYPVLAVLMLQHRLDYDPTIAQQFKGINWHELNARYKRDYAGALAEVLDAFSPPERTMAQDAIDKAYKELGELPLTIKRKLPA